MFVGGCIDKVVDKLAIVPSTVTLTFNELIEPLAGKVKFWQCLQMLFGASCCYYAYKIIRGWLR